MEETQKQTALGEGVDKNAEMRWIFVRNNRDFWVGCLKKDILFIDLGPMKWSNDPEMHKYV